MGFHGKKNKSPSERRGDALKNASGNASSKDSKKLTGGKPSGVAVSQERVLHTASSADILGVQPKPSVPKKEAKPQIEEWMALYAEREKSNFKHFTINLEDLSWCNHEWDTPEDSDKSYIVISAV